MPKRTLKRNKGKHIKKVGFRARMETRGGKKVLQARRKKGRKQIAI